MKSAFQALVTLDHPFDHFWPLQRLISESIAAAGITQQTRDLKEHLDELKVLYGQIPRTLSSGLPVFESMATQWSGIFGKPAPNPAFPTEDYEAFVRRTLEAKKALIENVLGVENTDHGRRSRDNPSRGRMARMIALNRLFGSRCKGRDLLRAVRAERIGG